MQLSRIMEDAEWKQMRGTVLSSNRCSCAEPDNTDYRDKHIISSIHFFQTVSQEVMWIKIFLEDLDGEQEKTGTHFIYI